MKIEQIDDSLFKKCFDSGVYPNRMVSDLGEVVFGYFMDENGCIIGTTNPPDPKEWIMYRYGVVLDACDN